MSERAHIARRTGHYTHKRIGLSCEHAGGITYAVEGYYTLRDYEPTIDWCPGCVAALTPLDDLEHTEL